MGYAHLYVNSVADRSRTHLHHHLIKILESSVYECVATFPCDVVLLRLLWVCLLSLHGQSLGGVVAAWLGAVLALSKVCTCGALYGGCVLATATTVSDVRSTRTTVEPLVWHFDGSPPLSAGASAACSQCIVLAPTLVVWLLAQCRCNFSEDCLRA